mmetsp:Transcript_4383/g.4509  ORF Transcript_4383/g.4509 Transcript_4383/m.4509 type:complete len:240 (+) Transcript_4383:212-931(+)
MDDLLFWLLAVLRIAVDKTNMSIAIILLLLFITAINADYGRPSHASHHISSYNPQGHMISDQSYFQAVDNVERSQVLHFIERTLIRLIDANDFFLDHNFKASLPPQIGGNVFDDKSNEDPIKALHRALHNLSLTTLNIKNFSFVMALVYMDRVATIMKIYSNGKSVRKIFGGCLYLACKMNGDDIHRDHFAEALGVTSKDLFTIETSLLNSIHDLTLHPESIMNYVRPMLSTMGGYHMK